MVKKSRYIVWVARMDRLLAAHLLLERNWQLEDIISQVHIKTQCFH